MFHKLNEVHYGKIFLGCYITPNGYPHTRNLLKSRVCDGVKIKAKCISPKGPRDFLSTESIRTHFVFNR